MYQSLLLISAGAAFGAITRWLFGMWFNPLFSTISFGTLIANYLGCLLIGIFTAIFYQFPQIPSEWKLFLITGLLGSLTTFSAFSLEIVDYLINGKIMQAINGIGLYVIGGFLCTFLGIYLTTRLVNV
ncbi:fluoride efflux transporter CrcB [Lonepinella koalarum]|uniref:Fluoride-specific ion channel FluC n=1 Tax=Lonepinella koalarum TaxID=53417 RepID=A0A4R1L4F2_9PAST|nr:fluoride efflux transporter CrcB [Lonepinella koalarum]MDH2925948.1 chromosome condensation protein CrcB [Lonepinella koalarum]TCK71099.1 camphor resistance protein CrcB [Lonepinella koalarum]TFJ90828.1 fluoride efflux transporter CrcB [Lonepinella koalarum]TYG34614.1 fluoride efflux transporter CrcB [Lonepinella koalarum]